MELIPILSLIILVSTISTFILAVGAYILYKVRERRGQAVKAKPPETIQAQLVEPKAVLTEKRLTSDKPLTEERLTGADFPRGGVTRATGEVTRPTFLSSPTYAEEHFRRTGSATRESLDKRRKFMRYTNNEITNPEPPEPPEPPKKNREDNLQWR